MIDLGQLVGKEYATHWRVKDPKSGEIEQITDVKELTKAYLDEDPFGDVGGDGESEDDDQEEAKEVIGQGVIDRDNRDIVDNNQA